MSVAQTYDFHLIFKGLFRCVPSADKKSLSILLVDARSPKSSPTTGEPLRDHRAVIEFPYDAWQERSPDLLDSVIEVNKPEKGKVGLLMLSRHDIRISASDGRLSPSLRFIDDGSAKDFGNLPQIADISPKAARVADSALDRGTNCIARVLDLDWGIVGSERPSTSDASPLKWSYSEPRKREDIERLIETESREKEQLNEELIAHGRLINLDVRVTAQVPAGASVVLDANPFPNTGVEDPTALVFRPPQGAQDVQVWIKNRELDVILTESDLEESEAGCTGEPADHDFELQYSVSEDPSDRKIPYRSDTLNGPVSAGGCACGGCTGG